METPISSFPEYLKCSQYQTEKYKAFCKMLYRKYFDPLVGQSLMEYYYPELRAYFSPHKVKINPDGFTSDRNINELILNKLSDEDLINACYTNKYVYSICQEPNFWMNRVIEKYGKYMYNYFKTYGNYTDVNPDYMDEVNKFFLYFKGEATWKEYYIWLSDLLEDVDSYAVALQALLHDRNDLMYLLLEMKNVVVVPGKFIKPNGTQIKAYFKGGRDIITEGTPITLKYPEDAIGPAEEIAPNGIKVTISYIKDGLMNGEVITYNAAGKIIEKSNYKDGKKIGKSEAFIGGKNYIIYYDNEGNETIVSKNF